jgi:hypothetical protein
MDRAWRFLYPVALAFCLFACSKTQTGARSNTVSDKPPGTDARTVSSDPQSAFAPLVGRIWRVSDAPYGPASGSIYIFLPNGTLLETSCVETYRIAVWSVDQEHPDELRVVEDQRSVFIARIGEASANTLHLHRKLLMSAEVQDITLTAVDSEFVCPDLRKSR